MTVGVRGSHPIPTVAPARRGHSTAAVVPPSSPCVRASPPRKCVNEREGERGRERERETEREREGEILSETALASGVARKKMSRISMCIHFQEKILKPDTFVSNIIQKLYLYIYIS